LAIDAPLVDENQRNSTKIGKAERSPAFSHGLGRLQSFINEQFGAQSGPSRDIGSQAEMFLDRDKSLDDDNRRDHLLDV
jgi:hypothetical protein